MSEPVFRKKLLFTASLSSTILSLSLLTGCASSPEKDPVSQAETQSSTQTEEGTVDNSKTNTTATVQAKVDPAPEMASSLEVSSGTAETETTIPNEQNTQTNLDATDDAAEKSSAILETGTAVATGTTVATQATIATGTIEASDTVSSSAAVLSQNPDAPVTRSEKDIGQSFGIWTLKKTGNGFCKLSTPTLQISTSNKDYSSQIWIDIEEQRLVVNAFMPMDITKPNTGIQVDNQALIPFTEKLYSTRAVVTASLTNELAQGKNLKIFINGKEVGKQILQRNVPLTNMSNAIVSLKRCGK